MKETDSKTKIKDLLHFNRIKDVLIKRCNELNLNAGKTRVQFNSRTDSKVFTFDFQIFDAGYLNHEITASPAGNTNLFICGVRANPKNVSNYLFHLPFNPVGHLSHEQQKEVIKVFDLFLLERLESILQMKSEDNPYMSGMVHEISQDWVQPIKHNLNTVSFSILGIS
jgi:hypothetical protein